MPHLITIDLPVNLASFKLPDAVASRLQSLLDRQDRGDPLNVDERAEAEGLTELSDLLTLLRLRTESGQDVALCGVLFTLKDGVPLLDSRGVW